MPLPSSAREGVVLLHGLCRSSASMKKMESFLSSNGYTVLNVDYDSRDSSISEIADSIIPASLNNPVFVDCERINFITHSLGGIVLRSYFSRNKASKLGRVVMLGPPNQGSEVVDNFKSWGLFKVINGPAGMELGTDELSTPNILGPVNFELGVIAGDRSINWINSLFITSPDDGKVSVERSKVAGMKDHCVIHVTHPYMMKRVHVMQASLDFIRNGEFKK